MEGISSTAALDKPIPEGGRRKIQSAFNEYNTLRTTDLGLLKSTFLPSIGLNSSLTGLSYLISYSTDRVEIKDVFWGGTQVINVWWAALGRPVFQSNLPITGAWDLLSWTQKLLVFSVSLWGTRLTYHIAARGCQRRKWGDNDDSRYDKVKSQQGFWKTAYWKLYLPEALFQSVIALPFTIPFSGSGKTLPTADVGFPGIARAAGVGLFTAGFALEVIADAQLKSMRGHGLQRNGAWSIVRHPNYLGDILVHASFALMSVADSFHPVVLLGPVANYVFLRFVGGDKENEAKQEARYKDLNEKRYREFQAYKVEKNSVWPSLRELGNPWTLAIAGGGVIAAFLQEVAKAHWEA